MSSISNFLTGASVTPATAASQNGEKRLGVTGRTRHFGPLFMPQSQLEAMIEWTKTNLAPAPPLPLAGVSQDGGPSVSRLLSVDLVD
jgi:hypothetical protein